MGRWAAAAALLAVAAAAIAVRLTTWSEVFAGAVRFVPDGDPLYHFRRIRMILEQGAIVWRDPWLDYPAGADIPWPPLFDLLLAGVSWIVGMGHPSSETTATVAAVAPVVLGVGGIALAAAFAAEIFGPAAGLGSALLLALSRPHVDFSVLGRADQHVLEILLFSAVALVFAKGLRDERLRVSRVLLFGAVLALSFWNWLGSAITLLVLGASCVAAGIAVDTDRPQWGRAARLLASGSAAAAVLLLASIGVAGPPGALRKATLGGLSAFQVMECAVAAILAASLLAARIRSRAARSGLLVAVPVVIFGIALVVLPALRAPVIHGLTAAGTGNPWYGSIDEYMPLVFSGVAPVDLELLRVLGTFGLWPLLALAGVFEAVWRMRAEPARASAILFALVVAVVFGVASAVMKRFMLYGSVPLAVFSSLGLALVHRRAKAWRPRAGALAAALAGALALAPTAYAFVKAGTQVSVPPQVEEALQRLREPPSGDFRVAVLAPWDLGHDILVRAERPVIASPFGTDLGASALDDLRAFYVESVPEAAELLLLRRGVRYVLLRTPVEEMSRLVGHGVRSAGGVRVDGDIAFEHIPDLVASRLFFAAGTATDPPARPALEGFRLVDEVEEDSEPVRIFELVPGATVRIRGARARQRIVARTNLTSPFGGHAAWWTIRVADERGEAVLRLPYATGPNGRIRASAFTVDDGARSAPVEVTEEQVMGGADLAVDLVKR